jgi:hypothetical protein
MKMTFEPVVAPGTFEDFGDLEYRLRHDFDDHWMQDDPMDSAQYDAVIRVGTRSQQLPLPPVHPPIAIFEGNAQWLDILLRACAPPGIMQICSTSVSDDLALVLRQCCYTLALCAYPRNCRSEVQLLWICTLLPNALPRHAVSYCRGSKDARRGRRHHGQDCCGSARCRRHQPHRQRACGDRRAPPRGAGGCSCRRGCKGASETSSGVTAA